MVSYDLGALIHKNIITMYLYFRAGSRNVIRLSRFVRVLFLAAVGLGIFAFTNSPFIEAADVPVDVGQGEPG